MAVVVVVAVVVAAAEAPYHPHHLHLLLPRHLPRQVHLRRRSLRGDPLRPVVANHGTRLAGRQATTLVTMTTTTTVICPALEEVQLLYPRRKLPLHGDPK